MGIRVICGAVAGLLVMGCGEVSLLQVDDSATGAIEAMNVPASIGTPNILVNHDPQVEGGEKTIYAVEDADIAFRRADGSLRPGDFHELGVGQHVTVRTRGARLTSAPAMMTAVSVEVLPGDET